VDKELHNILNKLSEFRKELLIDKNVGKRFTTNNKYLNEWYADQARKELLLYLDLIPNYRCRGLLKVILSRSARSARLVTHYDLDFPDKPQKDSYYCHKHSRTCSPVQEAYKFLHRYTIDTLNRIKEYASIRTNAKVGVKNGDSRKVDQKESIWFLLLPLM
jgi:hypothetical protein